MSPQNKKNNKIDLDEISKETQRLVRNGHVCLPYHKPKQKTLKDFLNRRKTPIEYHASITGSKKLLKKEWELIENKERNVENFYNEDCSQNENNENPSSCSNKSETEKTFTLNNDNDRDYDNKDNFSHETSLCSEKSVNQQVEALNNIENVQNNLNSSDFEDQHFINEAEFSKLHYSSNDENNKSNIINESDEEEREFKKKKKFRNFVLLESSDDESELESKTDKLTSDSLVIESQLNVFTQELNSSWPGEFKTQESEIQEDKTSDDDNPNDDDYIEDDIDENELESERDKLIANAFKVLIGDPDPIMTSQELMNLCSGEFKTQESEIQEDKIWDDDNPNGNSNIRYVINENDQENKREKLIANAFKVLIGDPDPIMTSQELMNLCSGEFKTQESEIQENQGLVSELPEVKEIEEMSKLTSAKQLKNEVELFKLDYSSIGKKCVIDINDESDEDDTSSIDEMPKIMSLKNFFDDEAELSESDWSSDDEEHSVIDTFEEEVGDKDIIDENVVKDGLNKIYIRQLMDDDQQEVNLLKEILLEDGNLHTDSGRKRKFQWDEPDQDDAIYKKPLFSDNEDEDNNLSDDDATEQIIMKERFKRESYLSLINNDECVESCEITKKIPIPVVKKLTYILPSKTFVKGSFIKCTNTNRMANSLMYMNKNSLIPENEIRSEVYEKNKEIKSKTTKSDNAYSYLMKTNKKQEIKNIRTDNLISTNKTEKNTNHRKPYTRGQSTELIRQTKHFKSNTYSILKYLK